jgi:hypothetical protein
MHQAQTNRVIQFYRVSDQHGCFSNFAPYEIELEQRVWPTSEHYFQAQKFDAPDYQEKIRLTKSPMIAARLGRSREIPIRRDWEQIKVDVMKKALRAKFTQHPELMTKLLATGDSILVEHTKNDKYWGDGGDGKGKNMLGKLLMELREELQQIR